MDTDDWRGKLAPDSRERIVKKITETLKRHFHDPGPEGLQEIIKKIAARLEENIYARATSQFDYLQKISLKMLTMENVSQHVISNSAIGSEPSNPGASLSMHPQVRNQGQSLPISMPANNSRAHQDLLSQKLQNNLTFNGFEPQASTTQQSLLATLLQPQQRVGQQSNADNRQQSLLIGQQNNLGDMQHQQQPLVCQQNNLQYLQQQQGQPLMAQQNNLSSMLQQQWLRARQVPMQGTMLQGSANLLPSQGQQLQPLDIAVQNKMTLTGVQSSVGLQPAMGPISGLTQNPIPTASGQNSTMQNIGSVPTLSNLMGKNRPANMYAEDWGQMTQRKQPESPNLQSLYQQVISQKLQQENLTLTLAKSHLQPQQQLQHQHQSLLQPNQLQPSQQSGVLLSSLMQPSMMQSAPLSGLQQNQPSSVQQSSQSMLQHQRSDLTQQLQQYLRNQFYIRNLPQQQLMVQQNSLSNMHQQLQDSQSNFSGLQQQQNMLGAQSGEPSMKTNQKSVQVMQQPNVPAQQKLQVPAQMPTHQVLQLHQLNEANVMRVRSGGTGISNKKIPGLQTQAPVPAILAFMLFVLCLLYVWFLF